MLLTEEVARRNSGWESRDDSRLSRLDSPRHDLSERYRVLYHASEPNPHEAIALFQGLKAMFSKSHGGTAEAVP